MFSRQRRLEKPRALLPACRPLAGGQWADIGSGDGVFAEVMLELTGGGSRLIGFDHHVGRLRQFVAWAESAGLKDRVSAVQGDFLRPLPFRGLTGLVMANGLHFVPDGRKGAVLHQLGRALAPGGQLILVEYNADRGNPAVPYPLREARLIELLARAGFHRALTAARSSSSFLGEMVAITARRA
jgi:SAM-dependent methyltransferase